MGMTMIQLADRLRIEADAYTFMEELRWPDGIAVCPHCDNHGATYIKPLNGKSRATRTGTQSQRRVWRCLNCRKQFSVITGTMMHGTKIPLRVWCLCIFELVSSKNGVAAREIERKYGVCCRTAWHMMHRIREAMKDDQLQTMRGVVIADETWIGGLPKWKKGHKYGQGGQGVTDKTPVLTLIDKERGESRSVVVPDVTGATLRKVISQQVDMANSVLHTDEGQQYRQMGKEFIAHETVNHKAEEWVRYTRDAFVSTNAAEGFFAQLKRSIDGTHHRVSKEHLPRYLAEFDYRYNTRKITDTERMAKLMTQTAGKRLSYKRASAPKGRKV